MYFFHRSCCIAARNKGSPFLGPDDLSPSPRRKHKETETVHQVSDTESQIVSLYTSNYWSLQIQAPQWSLYLSKIHGPDAASSWPQGRFAINSSMQGGRVSCLLSVIDAARVELNDAAARCRYKYGLVIIHHEHKDADHLFFCP